MIADADALGSSFGQLLENSRYGVIQLDRRARIVAANDRARGLLRPSEGLSDRHGALSALTPKANDELQRLLARALPPFGAPASAGSMTLGRPSGRTRLVLHITPVAERESDFRAHRVAALVLIVDPGDGTLIDPSLVAAALNLSPIEGRLAVLLAAGHTVRDVAAMTGRTEGTIRWHLKKIFRKQGISRQTDLVRLVLSLDRFPTSRPRTHRDRPGRRRRSRAVCPACPEATRRPTAPPFGRRPSTVGFLSFLAVSSQGRETVLLR